MSGCLEIVRFRVPQDKASAFTAKRADADVALRGFAGFLGSELVEGPDNVWTLLVRWASRADVTAAQVVTLSQPGLPAIAAWTALASEFISLETVDVRRAYNNAPAITK